MNRRTLMKPLRLPPALAVTFTLAAGILSAADSSRNWPAWRGPDHTGVSPTANPPTRWSEQENLRWKQPIPGAGTATPILWNDLVFVLTAIPDGDGASGSPAKESPATRQKFTVLALDRTTGKTRWERIARVQVPHEGHHKDHGFASASPVTDGEVLVASFGSYGIYGFTLKGDLLWEKDLGDMRTRNGFGEGSSPALFDNTVVVLWDHEGDDFIVALDRRTGSELWRVNREEPTGWSTPLILSSGGKPIVVVNGTNKVRAYDLATGRLLWEAGGQTANAIPSPVPFEDRVIVTSGFRGSALQVIRLGRSGDLTGSDAIVWNRSKNTPYVPSPLLYGTHLFYLSGNTAMLSIVDATTGTPGTDAERLPGIQGVYASPVGAAGRVYIAGRDGNTVVLKNALKLEVLATNKLDDGFDASPALSGADLLLRGRQSLYCISESR
ncbi:MAG: PQQ-binding-like beta-propeller repeat protein [Verrucomicrobiales bacterium]|nr:PQQ-binding-like beta-propeller repeat protein [Verrucomicrobiales bacterium]